MALVTEVLRKAFSNLMWYMAVVVLATFAATFYMNKVIGPMIGDFYSLNRSLLTIFSVDFRRFRH